MRQHKLTPEPWTWYVNPSSKSIELRQGRAPYDTVMGFVRWGMSSAAPSFPGEDGLLSRADEWTEVVPGREHHASWFRTLNHPNARLMAAAPVLATSGHDLAMLALQSDRYGNDTEYRDAVDNMLTALRSAGVMETSGGQP